MTDPRVPDISQKLQDELVAMLRERGADDESIKGFMREHDRVLEQFIRETDEKRAGFCPKCGHSWVAHDTELKGFGLGILPEYNPNGYEDVYQCNYYMGMGDWCGCEERSRRPAIPEHLRP